MAPRAFDDPIDAHLNEDVPARLWHYTSPENLLRIVDSNKFFASDVRYLNDLSEVEHGFVKMKLMLEQARMGWEMNNHAIDQIRRVILEDNRIYVISFTECDDDLSQWRGYSHNSFGVALGFDLSKVRERFPDDSLESRLSFARCVYKDHEQDVFLGFIAKVLTGLTQRIWPTVKEREPVDLVARSGELARELNKSPLLGYSLRKVLDIVALLKDSHFYMEREWRLIGKKFAARENKKTFHMSGPNQIVPHIAYPFDHFQLKEAKCGPGTDVRVMNGLKELLEPRGVVVTLSQVPYAPR